MVLVAKEGEKMDIAEEYLLSQYEELGELNGNTCVRLVRNAVTGKIAVKKRMRIEQKQIYDFLKSHRSSFTPEIYVCVEDGEQLVVIEEYFEGQNLEDLLSEHALSEEEACCIVSELCCALEPLHWAVPPIVCRDLKPENIMITAQKEVKLVDFDIARTVSPGKSRDTVVLGTKGFAAPEQCGYAQTDGRSDIYALGAVLNYCILRKLPVEERIDGKLGKVVEKCIALSPDERYQSVGELKAALKRIYPTEAQDGWKRGSGQDERESSSRQKGWERNSRQYEWERNRGQDGAKRRDIDHGWENRPEWEEESIKWRRFLPPGFRSGRVWKMAVAVMGYLIVINFSMTMKVKIRNVVFSGPRAWLQQIMFLLSQLAEIGIVFDYMGCQSRIPFLKTKNRVLRILIYIGMEFLLILITAVVWAVADTLIWG